MLRLRSLLLCATTVSAGSVVPPPLRSGLAFEPTDKDELENLSPKRIVEILDNYVVGQKGAKRAMAVSLRNRWRRKQVKDEGLRNDIMPKNILMIGPTGVGKTEIARRMAKITDAPFIKVEATKYTEVGFKGKDVESIIEDLYTNAKTKARRRLEEERAVEADKLSHDVIYTALTRQQSQFSKLTLEEYLAKFKAGELDNVMVTIEITVQQEQKPKEPIGMQIVLGGFGERKRRQSVTKDVKEAFTLARVDVLAKLINDSQVSSIARDLAEQEGIVFIDEIDKVVTQQGAYDADVSALGVQQDLLPLVEGSAVNMKDGTTINTDSILFVCSGAFHMAKPSDMIAELQGRLPVRVELQALNEDEFRRILVEPKFNLLMQQQHLLAADGVKVEFPEEGIRALARVTAAVNKNAQNIGARRLHTVIERVMDEYSFECDKYTSEPVVISAKVVEEATKPLLSNIDLAKYLL